MIRTSQSHPLRIDVLPCGEGRIGLTDCPGMRGPAPDHSADFGHTWARDLHQDMAVVAAFDPEAVVTLMELDELEHVGVPHLPHALREIVGCWLHLPIAPLHAPDAAFEARWRRAGPWIRRTLRQGGKVLIHGRAGVGRAGTLAARLLVELGQASPSEAIARVRAARDPRCVETRDQILHVLVQKPITASVGA